MVERKAGSAPAGPLGQIKASALEDLATLHPAYFSMVMATGVLDVACRLLGIRLASEALFWINLVAYGLLWGATLLRALIFPGRFRADWQDHQRGPGFFTTIAATCVVGIQFVVLRQDLATARILWWAGLGMWLVCMYAIFAGLTVKETKPSLEDGINGGWLAAVVATQAVSVLGCMVAPTLALPGEAALFLMASLWLCGGMLYIWLISLIFYRYTFLRFRPSDLMPPYWINMGAMAISTLAGTLLIKAAPDSPFLTSLLPFLKGFTLLYWATATWWIPMLLILGVWRHVSRKVALTYDPLYWGAVFPLAMYTSATYRMARILDLPFLVAVPRLFIAAALSAWLLTFLGLLLSVSRTVVKAFRPWRAAGTADESLPRPSTS
ncbi:MAG TPA: tellurite resistance/C4-dicarboxylate transporter family protein [Holophagaceae bacterium]|nr:tellurite resistance/C4-dicarboxylate transporter family protein [Holophagaceae bacterium]